MEKEKGMEGRRRIRRGSFNKMYVWAFASKCPHDNHGGKSLEMNRKSNYESMP
jgi:hypothetical protein